MKLRDAQYLVPDFVKNQLADDEVAMLDTDTGNWFGVRDGDHEEHRNVRRLGRVVHVKAGGYDVYVGRGVDPATGEPSIWGNPFIVGKHGGRGNCILLHREWLKGQQELLSRMDELRGKTLGCWCAPDSCHADTLVYLANRPLVRAA